ncbi:MAG TPA: DUF808 domain-containing protein [Steroidobacteraceae bacterium]|nr:DUF808 domain-containing protein [Steroidobacteraceae bacterium]
MAGASLLTLLDDIATILDDVSLMTKIATKKTAGVLGDDLALNAQQVTGVRADRELPVVWDVAKGSLRNKAILVPAALVISAIAPWAITPLLMLGGLFLCYEGFEKIWHGLVHREQKQAHREELREAVKDPSRDLRQVERAKIKGAIRTDFILSAEIIVITLGTVADASFTVRIAVLIAIALLMTVGVYGLVAAIVKLDDVGLHLVGRPGDGSMTRVAHAAGRGILAFAPWLMKSLSIVGTAAMFLVGGGILLHGLPPVAHWVEHLVAGASGPLGALASALAGAVLGIIAGGLTVMIVSFVRTLWPGGRSAAEHK